MTELSYIVFVLGYDLLNNKLDRVECDIAFDECVVIAEEFLESEEYKQDKGTYDCLVDFLERKEII